MMTTICLVNIHYLIDTNKRKKKFFPCDENSGFTLLTSFIYHMYVYCAKSFQLCPTLCKSVDHSHQAPLSMGFSRQEYWSGLPFPIPGDLANPGNELLCLLHWQVGCLPLVPPGKPHI